MRLLDSLLARLSIDVEGDEDLAAKIRAYQIDSVAKVTPLMMAANVINAGIIVAYIYPQSGSVFLLCWGALIASFAAYSLFHRHRYRRRFPVVRASRRGIGRVIRNALILGAAWGLLPAIAYPGADTGARVMITAAVAGMLGGGSLVMYVVPPAMYAWIGAICAGTAYALVRSGEPGDLATALLVCMFVIALARSGSSMSRIFAANRASSLQVKDQASTIAMLLNDFSESARDWLWETNSKGELVRGAEHFCEQCGFTLQSLSPEAFRANGQNAKLIGGHKTLDILWKSFGSMAPFEGVLFQIKDAGKTRWLALSGKPIFDEDQAFLGFRGVASDITDQKEAEERIAYLAYNDALTGLVNRSTFRAALDAIADTGPESTPGVLYVDLDGFKPVNDSYGHNAGDSLLVEIGQRLRRTVGERDVVARLGGDEFAILARSATTTQSASALAEKIIEAVNEPFSLEGTVMQISASVGIAFAGRDGLGANALLHNADLALYRAKSESKGAFRFYEIEMDEVVRQRRMLENDLREAVRTKSLGLAFQPLIDAETEATTGFEALVRWNHPEQGQIPPDDFIPVAERIGLISQIGQWVLNEACRQATEWPEGLRVAVNLSPQQFRESQVVDHVKWALETSGLDPHRLELEITESLFIQNTDDVMSALSQLKEMGVSIALDDFGTGYSSLSYLLKFPFDKLKIDRTFISSINEDAVARDVLEAITKLGRILNLSVTAEGVETHDQAESLKAMACTHFQGFHFGRPLGPADLGAYLLREFERKVEPAAAAKKPVRARRRKAAKAS